MSTGPRHLRSLLDLGRDGILHVLDRAAYLKKVRGRSEHPMPLRGKSVAVLLEKASTRTRVSFEVGIAELGGQPLTIQARDTQLGRGEPLPDTARMLSGYVHAVAYRTFGHDRVETLARESTIPVINALSDKFHPCQMLADLLAVRESLARIEGIRVAWIGDGNNVAHCWILAAGLMGFNLTLACPTTHQPLLDVVETGRTLGRGSISLSSDPQAAARGAHVVSTDVWASMGQESEAEERRRAFSGFTVDAGLMSRAARDAIFLHCLPAHRGEEVTAEVIDGPQSRVWIEAENRLHTQKALLEHLVTP